MNKQAKVLIVEDDKLIQKAMKMQFKKEGFMVKTANDGVEAMKILKTWIPSAVILDLLMPNKDGYQVLREIKNNQELKGMPVLIVSNLNQEDQIMKGINLSASEFFIKGDMSLKEVIRKTLYHINVSTHGKKSVGIIK